jgi:hypothetical protein
MRIKLFAEKWLVMLVVAISISACQSVEYIPVGPNWDELNRLKASDKTFNVTATVKDSYKLGDRIDFLVNSEQDGKLWIVRVDPNDEVSMLFPHDYAKDNKIKANENLQIPSNGASWHLEASKPLGKSIVAFIVTTGDTSLSDVINNQKSMPKALRLVESSPQWGIYKRVIDVQ